MHLHEHISSSYSLPLASTSSLYNARSNPSSLDIHHSFDSAFESYGKLSAGMPKQPSRRVEETGHFAPPLPRLGGIRRVNSQPSLWAHFTGASQPSSTGSGFRVRQSYVPLARTRSMQQSKAGGAEAYSKPYAEDLWNSSDTSSSSSCTESESDSSSDESDKENFYGSDRNSSASSSTFSAFSTYNLSKHIPQLIGQVTKQKAVRERENRAKLVAGLILNRVKVRPLGLGASKRRCAGCCAGTGVPYGAHVPQIRSALSRAVEVVL